jgi:hypothetical protein
MGEGYASDWGFVKLLLGLDTGLAGVLIYGQEHILRVQNSKWLLAACVLLLVISLLLSLQCARILVTVDAFREERNKLQQINPMYRFESDVQRFVSGEMAKFKQALNVAILLFGCGVVAGFCFFIWNLPLSAATEAVSNPPGVSLQLPFKESNVPTTIPCDPLQSGWQFAPSVSKARYFFLCLVFALVLRLLHSAWRAFAVTRGDFPDAKESNIKKWGEAFKLCLGGFNKFKEHSDLFLPTVIGFFELASYPVLLALGQYSIIGGWVLIKTAGSWTGYKKSRTSFNRFLVFNILTLLLAYWLSYYVKRLPC